MEPRLVSLLGLEQLLKKGVHRKQGDRRGADSAPLGLLEQVHPRNLQTQSVPLPVNQGKTFKPLVHSIT